MILEVPPDVGVRIDVLHRVTDEELGALSERNPGYQFERTREGRLTVSPTGGRGGKQSGEAFRQLSNWAHTSGGGVAFDSSTGFDLPDGSCLCPDAAWLRRERWDALSSDEQVKFVPLCPDAAFEVRSPFDSLGELREKMRSYVANGTPLAVLVDPEGGSVEAHRPGRPPERHEGTGAVPLDPDLPGFVLDPALVFAG